MSETTAALLGVVLGAVISFLFSLAITYIQRRSQREYEIWIRILNSYQDFAHFARQLMKFRDASQRELWQQSVSGVIKAMNDANTLDPHGATRREEMQAILDALMTDSPIETAEADALERRIQRVFNLYKEDARLKYPKID
jgi:beta-galactosidase GanA